MNNEQAYIQLNKTIKSINNGYISFSDAAKKISDDFSSAQKGGDLGWHPINKLNKQFQNIFLYLNIGDISPPIQDGCNWHLFQLIDIRHVDKTYELKKNKVYNLLFDRKLSEASQIWLQKQRYTTYVNILNKK